MAVCLALRTLGIKVAIQQSYRWIGAITTIQRRYVMKENVRDQLQMRLRRAAVAVFAIGAVAAGTVHAGPSNTVVVVPPTDLPALARPTGEAMLFHETFDGRILPYIEQNQGARLATFDVTDPVHIKGEGSVHFDASGSFDFVSPLVNQAELVRLPGPISDAGTNAFTVTSPTIDAPPALYFGAIDTVLSYELNRLFDVKQVRAQMTRSDTGSTFKLTMIPPN
jgi:hypothetical protein